MKILALIGLCLFTSIATADEGDDVPPPSRASGAVPQSKKLSPEEASQLRNEKTAQLQRLQKEILELGGTISDPTRIKVTIRVIEMDEEKLKKLKKADPFEAKLTKGAFENDEALLRVLEPLVENGCAKVLANTTIITSSGQATIINSFREFPRTEEDDSTDDLFSVKNASTIPGYRIILKPVLQPEGDILLTVGIRLNIEDLENGVVLNGKLIPGVNSRAVTATRKMQPGIPVSIGGGRGAIPFCGE